MDMQSCAKILWIITADFKAIGYASELISMRRALAQAIITTDGKGFPQPTDVQQEALSTEAWEECCSAAQDIFENRLAESDPIRGHEIKFVLLAPNGIDDKPDIESLDENITWPASSKPDFSYGPVLDGTDRKVHLVCYSEIDRDIALKEPGLGTEGLYPNKFRNLSPKLIYPLARKLQNKNRAAFWVFILAFCCGAFSLYLIYSKTQDIRNNIRADNGFFQSLQIDTTNSTVKYNNQIVNYDNKDNIEGPQFNCIMAIDRYLKRESTIFNVDACNDILFRKTNGSSNSSLSLIVPLLISSFAIILFVISAGLAKRGHWLGAFVDDRNRVSLSSTQQLLWTVVLFGGITILGIFNIALLSDSVRSIAQVSSDQEGFLANVSFFPEMNLQLWLVLGLTVVASPLASKFLVSKNVKNDIQSDKPELIEAQQVENEPAVNRSSLKEADWSDLFTDEKQPGSNKVDISRLQHLVITGLLLGGYLIMLVGYVRDIDASAIYTALLTGFPVFREMPPIDDTFIILLGISHGSYLAFKKLP